MTITKLYELLHRLVRQGHGSMAVCIDKDTFRHNCEADGVTILDIQRAEIVAHTMDDGDGCAIINRDGSERLRSSLVLTGDSAVSESI